MIEGLPKLPDNRKMFVQKGVGQGRFYFWRNRRRSTGTIVRENPRKKSQARAVRKRIKNPFKSFILKDMKKQAHARQLIRSANAERKRQAAFERYEARSEKWADKDFKKWWRDYHGKGFHLMYHNNPLYDYLRTNYPTWLEAKEIFIRDFILWQTSTASEYVVEYNLPIWKFSETGTKQEQMLRLFTDPFGSFIRAISGQGGELVREIRISNKMSQEDFLKMVEYDLSKLAERASEGTIPSVVEAKQQQEWLKENNIYWTPETYSDWIKLFIEQYENAPEIWFPLEEPTTQETVEIIPLIKTT